MKTTLFFLLALLGAVAATAQPFDAVRGLGSTGADGAAAVAVDTDGKAYVTGTFEGTLELGAGVTITSAGGLDAFVVKLDEHGAPLWARRAGAPGSNDAGLSIAVEMNFLGEPIAVYVTGTFSGTAPFDGGFWPDTTLTAVGGTDGFLAKYTVTGNLYWACRLGGPLEDAAEGVALGYFDAAYKRDVYVAGRFEGTAEVGDATLASAGGSDAFLARFDADGDLVWARRAGGPQHDAAYNVAVAIQGDAFVVGQFEGEAAFGGIALQSAGGSDIFVARYGSDGGPIWAERLGGVGADYARAVALEVQGEVEDPHVFVGGAFSETITVGPDALTSAGLTDVLVAALTPEGTPSWGRRGGGAAADGAEDVQTFPPVYIPTRGEPNRTPPLYVTGFVEGTADFSSPDTTVTLTAAGARDGFLAAYKSTKPEPFGALLSAFTFGGEERDEGTGVTLHFQSNAYDLDPVVVGFFRGTATFGDHLLTSTGGSDAFYASLLSCPALYCTPTTSEPPSEQRIAALAPPAPNPARHATTLTLTLAQPQHVAVEVVDVLGRRVALLHEGLLAAGAHPLVLDAGGLPVGLYVVRAIGEGFQTSRHVTVAR